MSANDVEVIADVESKPFVIHYQDETSDNESSENEDSQQTVMSSPPRSLISPSWIIDTHIEDFVKTAVADKDAQREFNGNVSPLNCDFSASHRSPSPIPLANKDQVSLLSPQLSLPLLEVSPPTPSKSVPELILSPASQLNILSHISELADRRERTERQTIVATLPQAQQRQLWNFEPISAQRYAQHRHCNASKRVSDNGKTNNVSKRFRQPKHLTERLMTEMLDWDPCQEAQFFTNPNGHTLNVMYEELSDSDF